MNVPRATYRLQLHAGFGFGDAAAIAPYLAQLGVSHVYLSPIFKARPGSVHGYDVTDHNQLNPELGTENDFSSMIDAFRDHGLGRILDIVPNHVGVGAQTIRCGSMFWSGVPTPNMPAGSTSTGRLKTASCSRRCLARNMAKS